MVEVRFRGCSNQRASYFGRLWPLVKRHKIPIADLKVGVIYLLFGYINWPVFRTSLNTFFNGFMNVSIFLNIPRFPPWNI